MWPPALGKRLREIHHFDEGRSGQGAVPADHALAHRNDEFPAGYSSAGCSPAVPASASPAGGSLPGLILIAKDFAANGKLSLITLSQPWSSLQREYDRNVIVAGNPQAKNSIERFQFGGQART